jgi:tetratricopeptide (TPR) repeat protein
MLLLVLVGCKKDDVQYTDRYELKGKVEKGPFVRGSEVTVYELSERLERTGISYTKTVQDDQGNFDFGILDIRSPYVEIVATGAFYNELTGEQTSGSLSLRSIADLSNQKSVNVNVFTHLETRRLLELNGGEKRFKAVSQQAHGEVLKAFGLQRFEMDEVNTYSLTDGIKGAGSLLVVSASLLKDKTETRFAEYLEGLCEKLKETGTLPDDTKEEIRKNAVSIDWTKVAEGLVAKYKETGLEITVPDLSYFIDWDGDGEAGNEFGGIVGDKKLKFKTDTLRVSQDGGEYAVDILANLSYDFTYPGMEEEEVPKSGVEVDKLFQFKSEEMDYTVTLDKVQGQLKLTVQPAKGYWIRDERITLYSLDGEVSATLLITQDGDMNKFEVPEGVEEAVSGILGSIREACDYMYTIEAYYTQCFPEPQNKWQKYYRHEKSSPQFKLLRSIMYYPLIVLWGNIPYPEHFSTAAAPRLTEQKAYEKLAADLEEIHRLILDWRSAEYQDYIGIGELMLGKVYMQLGRYNEAKRGLEIFLKNEGYAFNASRKEALNSGSKELVFGLDLLDYPSVYTSEIADHRYLPVGSYTEALLLLAECTNRIGDRAKAMDYLNQVRKNYRLSEATDFDQQLKATWKELLKGEFAYFAFLKRNDLCEKELGIEAWQKLLPFPESEVGLGGAEQNPGY